MYKNIYTLYLCHRFALFTGSIPTWFICDELLGCLKKTLQDIVFQDCVAVNPGIMRPNWYGNCVATYGHWAWLLFEFARFIIPSQPLQMENNLGHDHQISEHSTVIYFTKNTWKGQEHEQKSTWHVAKAHLSQDWRAWSFNTSLA